MALPCADENFPRPVIERLRAQGHDVLTALEAGQANRRIGDPDVLAFATADRRAVLTSNRRDFIQLHRRTPVHAGIVVCTADPDIGGQAERIGRPIESCGKLTGLLLHAYRLP